jgi:hypothetical protein
VQDTIYEIRYHYQNKFFYFFQCCFSSVISLSGFSVVVHFSCFTLILSPHPNYHSVSFTQSSIKLYILHPHRFFPYTLVTTRISSPQPLSRTFKSPLHMSKGLNILHNKNLLTQPRTSKNPTNHRRIKKSNTRSNTVNNPETLNTIY